MVLYVIKSKCFNILSGENIRMYDKLIVKYFQQYTYFLNGLIRIYRIAQQYDTNGSTM